MSIVLIGVAIAGTTSILAIINGVVFRPLPRAGAEGLVRVVESSTSRPPASTVVSNLTYTLWADRHDTIVGLGAWDDDAMTLTGGGDVERVRVARVTPSLFPVLGVAPILGAPFKDSEIVTPDYENNGGTTVILSHGFGGCRKGANDLLAAGMLHRNGIAVLMIDLRDHGDSTKEDMRFAGGTEEYRDVLGAWDWLSGRGVP